MPARPNASSQVYFAGDFWNCISATTAGDSPTTDPEKWSRIEIPSDWRNALAKLAHARLLDGEGNNDKASATRLEAYALLDDMRETRAQRGGRRPAMSVTTR